MRKNTKLIYLIFFILVSQLAGIIGSAFTFSSIPTWYKVLVKPFFSPPNWIFGPVWIILYVLMGIAAFLVWNKGTKKEKIKNALVVFGIQLIFNSLWSIIFFGLHLPGIAFIEIVILWFLIFLNFLKFYKISKVSGLLFIPYILWVSFAAVLNFFIFKLN